MTHPANTAMTLERLAQLLDAYGGEASHWPERERAAALQLIAAEPEAQRLQREALALDGMLTLPELPEASSALRARVLEIPIKHAPAAESGWSIFGARWKLAVLALTPCVIGFLSGTLLMDPSADTDDDAWDELAAVVMPAALSDDLDMFEEDTL